MGMGWLLDPPITVSVPVEDRRIEIRPRRLVPHSKAMLEGVTYMCGFVGTGLAACTGSAFPVPAGVSDYIGKGRQREAPEE
jgi:hypothetical protein